MRSTLAVSTVAFTDDVRSAAVSLARSEHKRNGETSMTERTQNLPTRTIRIAHSPDSDDAFMFYALSQEKLDTGNLRFEHELSDIESLNRRALTGELEVSAVSI